MESATNPPLGCHLQRPNAGCFGPRLPSSCSIRCSDIAACGRARTFGESGDRYADIERLAEITEKLPTLADAATALPALFGVLERHPDDDLGAPGPVVHTIEAIGGHIPELLKSIGRVPVDLTVWMVNRLLNSELDANTRKALMETLRDVADNETVTEDVRESSRRFLAFQGG